MDYVRDLDAFSKFLLSQYKVNITDIFVVANSIGGVVASAWAHDFAPGLPEWYYWHQPLRSTLSFLWLMR
jgi:alpha-beta hydrolase superfamily lysophospholipase